MAAGADSAWAWAWAGGMVALEDVSFRVAAGETVGVVGPNGAGKTTLFLCLSGVLRVKPGMVRLAGLDPGSGPERRRLPEHVGIIFQHSDDQLFNVTVFDDVAFGPLNLGLSPEEVRRRVTEALARVRLQGFEQRVPFHLSGGEKRRHRCPKNRAVAKGRHRIAAPQAWYRHLPADRRRRRAR